jgi:beta-lactamase class D
MQNSVVPLYQGIARAVGEERMRHYVERVSYGNAAVNGGIDRFWLDGALRISAIEQIDFLKQLYFDKLPFTKQNQLIVKDALITEASNDYLLRAKTGYSLGAPGYGDRTKPGVAWWVGWIEKGTAVYFFAANFDIEKDSQLASRKTIPANILRTQGILP